MSRIGKVVSVNTSEKKGTAKFPQTEILVGTNGIQADGHAGDWHRQVSFLDIDSLNRFREQTGKTIQPGQFAENITVADLDLRKVLVLDTIRIGSVTFQVTQIGKACHGSGCAIFQEVGRCAMPKEGIFCRVLQGGILRPGDPVEILKRKLKIRIITLSDRCFHKQNVDRSGPYLEKQLQDFLQEKNWQAELDARLLPDDAESLKSELLEAQQAGIGMVFTTGGTGVGPRDVTPDIAKSLCPKEIPGIMEFIRIKHGHENPSALLSRSFAGLMDPSTVVFCLPGSLRAVQEYLEEIKKHIEHLLYMLAGLDMHQRG